jgi:hypothetical protein
MQWEHVRCLEMALMQVCALEVLQLCVCNATNDLYMLQWV